MHLRAFWKFLAMSDYTITFLVIVIFLYVLMCGWLWDPLGWLIQSEVFALEIRSAAQSIVVCVNMFFTLYVQLFLFSLCHLKYGFFLICFVLFLLPETKEVSTEEIDLSSFRKPLVLEQHCKTRDERRNNIKWEASSCLIFSTR